MHPRHVVICNGVSTIAEDAGPAGPRRVQGRGAPFRARPAAAATGRASARWCWAPGRRATTWRRTWRCRARPSVTIIQNRPTLVVSLKEAQAPYALYDEDISFEDCDLLATSFPYPGLRARASAHHEDERARPTAALLEGLKKRGFKLTSGRDGTGWQIMYRQPRRRLLLRRRLLADDRRRPRRPDPVRRHRTLRAPRARA